MVFKLRKSTYNFLLSATLAFETRFSPRLGGLVGISPST